MAAHARLGPSNHRWPHCPGSVREEAQYPDVSGAAAIDGTGSHLLLEMCLENGVRAEVYDGQIIGTNHPDNPNGWLIYPDRIERVQMCLDYINRRVNELLVQYPDATAVVDAESKADPGGAFGRCDWWGTVDITITVADVDGRCLFLEVVDYKDGRGWVTEKNNSQLVSYAFGKARPHVASGPDLVRPFRNNITGGVRMTIVQPKTNPVIRYYDQSTDWLINEAGKLNNAARATDDPDAPLTPGKHCEWCKANMKRGGHCTASTQQSLEAIKMFDVTPTDTGSTGVLDQLQDLATDLTTLPADKLSQLLDARAVLEAAFDRLEAEAERRIETGVNVPGYALKPGRTSRVWNTGEDELVKALKGRRLKKDDMYPPKLLSPAQFENLDCLTDDQKQKFLDKYCTSKAGKLKLSKVAHGEEKNPFKDVAVSNTTVIQSEPEVTTTPEISFF